MSKRLYRQTAETLVVWGAEDKFIPPVYAERWAELLPNARVVSIEGAGHMVPYEQTEAVADAVRRFYDGFRAAMDTDGVLEDVLPFYAGKLAYYQRLNANALSRSIRASTTLSGDRDKPVREWALQLPSAEKLLLG